MARHPVVKSHVDMSFGGHMNRTPADKGEPTQGIGNPLHYDGEVAFRIGFLFSHL